MLELSYPFTVSVTLPDPHTAKFPSLTFIMSGLLVFHATSLIDASCGSNNTFSSSSVFSMITFSKKELLNNERHYH